MTCINKPIPNSFPYSLPPHCCSSLNFLKNSQIPLSDDNIVVQGCALLRYALDEVERTSAGASSSMKLPWTDTIRSTCSCSVPSPTPCRSAARALPGLCLAAWAPGQGWPPLPAAQEERWTGRTGAWRQNWPARHEPSLSFSTSPPATAMSRATYCPPRRTVARLALPGRPARSDSRLLAAASHAYRYLYYQPTRPIPAGAGAWDAC